MPGLEVSGYSCGVLILWFSWFEKFNAHKSKNLYGEIFWFDPQNINVTKITQPLYGIMVLCAIF